MKSKILNFLLSQVPDGNKNVKNFYTSEILNFIIVSNLVGYLVFCVLQFFFETDTISAAVCFCIFSTGIFLYLISINNQRFKTQKEELLSLVVSKDFTPIKAYSAFYNNLKDIFLAGDTNYIGTISSDIILSSDVPNLFVEIFGQSEFEKPLKTFVKVNGNVILFAKNISEVQHEALLRYYLTRTNG